MVSTPSASSSSSRLSALKNARSSLNRSKQQYPKQTGIGDYLKRASPIPQQHIHQPQQRSQQNASSSSSQTTNARHQSPVLSETQNSSTHSNKILDGVVACLDVRTEDGDDVSQNFERALQSMGAKTRRTFSDSITHLIFKNGSPATLKKALSKNVFILNLLWISRCKREGRRVEEKDFIIERPQGLVLAGKKRRKSMEPGKVRALVMNELMQPSLSSSSDSSVNDEQEMRRKTIATSGWKARDFTKEAVARKKVRHDFEEDEDPLDGVAAEVKLSAPRLSLPISVESIASRHINNTNSTAKNIIPVHAPPSLEKREQIKARFSIGSKSSTTSTMTEEDTVTSKMNPGPRSPIPSSATTPIRRKRRLTGNLSRLPSSCASDSLSLDKLDIIPPKVKSIIVLTSMTLGVRKRCEEAIQKLDTFELATEVTENTTHVLVGVQRRTKSVALGLLRGAWILKPEWLFDCLSKNQAVSEKDYELVEWYPRAPLARQKIPLLPSTTLIKVTSSIHGVEFIEELIILAGGHTTKTDDQANIVISDEPIKGKDKIVVSDKWLFDSIEQWKYLPTEAYSL